MANTVLQDRKKNNKKKHITFLSWKCENIQSLNTLLKMLTYSFSHNHTTLLYIQIHSEGQGENIKIPECKNATCRNGAYIPNTQPFSLSSEGKNKW